MRIFTVRRQVPFYIHVAVVEGGRRGIRQGRLHRRALVVLKCFVLFEPESTVIVLTLLYTGCL